MNVMPATAAAHAASVASAAPVASVAPVAPVAPAAPAGATEHPSNEALAGTLAELLGNASIEITVREAAALADAAPFLPGGTGIYVPSLPSRPLALSLPLLADIRARGFDPVPHVAARRVTASDDLPAFVARAVREHGVHRVMLIGGDEPAPLGPWRDSAQLLQSGLLRDAGVREIGIAVYPEGHPKIAQAALQAALQAKLEAAAQQGLGVYAVTQSGLRPSASSRCWRRCTSSIRSCPSTSACRAPATPCNCCVMRSAAASAPRGGRCRRWARASRS
ncbi:MAG: hypothetical protein U1F25_01690 [Rubrivivax sp.]